jgi:hypothetical protein
MFVKTAQTSKVHRRARHHRGDQSAGRAGRSEWEVHTAFPKLLSPPLSHRCIECAGYSVAAVTDVKKRWKMSESQ